MKDIKKFEEFVGCSGVSGTSGTVACSGVSGSSGTVGYSGSSYKNFGHSSSSSNLPILEDLEFIPINPIKIQNSGLYGTFDRTFTAMLYE